MEKFCLRWNDFSQNVGTIFQELREDSDFTDVTLVSEDRQQIAAHKVILSAASPFFRKILKHNKHSHPLIYMRGIKVKDMVSIVDFIYHGEVNTGEANSTKILLPDSWAGVEIKIQGQSYSQNWVQGTYREQADRN